MLEVGEYYTYVSNGSEFEVDYVGDGDQSIYLQDGTRVSSQPVQVYLGKTNKAVLTVVIGKKNRHLSSNTYKSSGSIVPIKYLGEGRYHIELASPSDPKYNGMSFAKHGSVFEMYGKPLVVDETALQDKVHPTEVVMDHLERIPKPTMSILRGSVTGRVTATTPATLELKEISVKDMCDVPEEETE